ncbi:MAG: tRNA dihydrouridine synthase DusB [Bacillota bacterium]|nr:tRNA dihydrouridine synthase DusB [Bacillota bacterium]
MSLTFGSIKISPGLALAPMAGITNHPFRLIAKEQGCPLVYTEMISAKGVVYNGRRTYNLFYHTDQERPIGFQIFGSDPVIMAEAASIIENVGADFIDLNLGCPTRKITRNSEGGALMREPKLCSSIFRAVVSAVNCPVTVKLRKGWNEYFTNVVDVARRAEAEGIGAVTVHGRTVEQGYSGRADWDSITAVKAALTIPVIGNGDINSPQAAEAMFRYTGCDGIMIGRAARGNPWIFNSVRAKLEGKPEPQEPTLTEIVHMIYKHFMLLNNFKGEILAAREMRRHANWYIRGIPGAAAIRHKLTAITSYDELKAILEEFLKKV